MRTRIMQNNTQSLFVNFPNQQPLRLNMTFPISGIFTKQFMRFINSIYISRTVFPDFASDMDLSNFG